MTQPNQSELEQKLDEKTRSICKQTFPITQFHKDTMIKSGYRSRCKRCTSLYYQDYYAKNSERIDAKNEADRRENWEKVKLQTYARRDPQKHKARQSVNNALRSGKLHRQPCGDCGNRTTEFHHTNGYDKADWFVGIWLCRTHHAELHKLERRQKWVTA